MSIKPGARYAVILFLLVLCVTAWFAVRRRDRKPLNETQGFNEASLAEFVSLEPIDAHTHILQTGPVFTRMLERLNLHVLDILFVDDTTPYLSSLATQRDEAWKFAASANGRAKICTTFDPFRFHDSTFASEAIAGLNRDFQDGAVAVKIWKNVGMEIRLNSGQFLMPDDPVFEPIYRDIAAHNSTLIMHEAAVDQAWDPKNAAAGYFATHPQWNMSKPGSPEKMKILQARDHVVATHPELRVIGAHFGSLTEHLDQLATILDQHPNFAVDTAARIRLLAKQPREVVRTFILKYQDRILYGTDLEFRNGADDLFSARSWENQYKHDWQYLATDNQVEVQGRSVEGLNLPKSVLKKLYHDNAVRWIPGIYSPPPANTTTIPK